MTKALKKTVSYTATRILLEYHIKYNSRTMVNQLPNRAFLAGCVVIFQSKTIAVVRHNYRRLSKIMHGFH